MDNVLTPENQRWRACVHESGHSIAALLLGMPGHGCAVFGDTGDGVATTADIRDAAPTPDIPIEEEIKSKEAAYKGHGWRVLLDNATLTAAGCAAEDLILDPTRDFTRVEGVDRIDLDACCREAIGQYADNTVQTAFAYLASARARALLKSFVGRVENVARELDRKSKLTADQIIEAMYPEHVRLAKDETETANINTTPEERP